MLRTSGFVDDAMFSHNSDTNRAYAQNDISALVRGKFSCMISMFAMNQHLNTSLIWTVLKRYISAS